MMEICYITVDEGVRNLAVAFDDIRGSKVFVVFVSRWSARDDWFTNARTGQIASIV